jgi:transcriptional regulator with XRE-family HTH domain
MAPIDYQALLAGNLRQRRGALGWTQGDLASRARAVGLQWTVDTVVSVESGRRKLSYGDVLLLTQVLRSSLGEYPGDQDIDVEGCVLPAPGWRLLVEGVPMGGLDRLREAMVARDQTVNREASNEAEKKAARSLHMSAKDVVFLAHGLWGRGLTEERDHRLSSELGAVEVTQERRQALRGHITRGLLQELREAKPIAPKRTAKRPASSPSSSTLKARKATKAKKGRQP